jgi:hypothetical protein
MSHAGLKQQLIAVPNVEPVRQSGRYEIDERRSDEARQTTTTERADATQKIALLMEVNTLSDEELSWIKARSSHPPKPLGQAAGSSQRAVFAKEGEEDKPFGALQPFYREPTLERVQLQFEDLSLDPTHNPLARSSLLPPARRHPQITRAWAIAVGALALSSVGYLAALASGAVSSSAARATTVFSPARRALAPHVVEWVPTELPGTASQPSAHPELAPPADDVLWSVNAPADTLAPDAPLAAKPVARRAPAAIAPAPAQPDRSPGWNRRRIMALRARLAAARSATAAQPLAVALPAQPSREEIRSGIENVHAALQSCAGAAHGMTTAKLNIAGSGRVASATIEGAFAGTPQGSCMARALRSAAFPRFSTATLQVTYPFRL